MSNIKVAIKIRPLIEHELKSRHDEQWILTDNNSLRCTDFLHACNFTFDHIFDKKSPNYQVYLAVVKPIVESCLAGFNGTILTYGQTSAGKNYTMMGTDKDPGIILLALTHLFQKTHQTLKIRVGYIEIYKERIYDLFNDRKRIEYDPNGLANGEILVESVDKTVDILKSGSYKRKSSPTDENKLSSISNAIFRITIESEEKSSGLTQRSYLKFVHVAGCEPATEKRSSDSVMMLKNAGDGNKSLLCLNFVLQELSEGKKDVDFSISILTSLLTESLSGNSNTAVICNMKPDDVEETISTLKFASQAKNVRTTPVRNGLNNDQESGKSDSIVNQDYFSPLAHRLKEMANTKVENLLLRKELEEVRAAFDSRTKWFEEQMRTAEFVQQKLELAQMADKKLLDTVRLDFEQKTKNMNTVKQDLLTRCEELHQSNSKRVVVIQNLKESVNRLKRENSQLRNANDKLMDKNQIVEEVGSGFKRKIERLEDDWTKNIKKLRSEFHSKMAEVETSTSTEWTGSVHSDETEASHTLTVSDHLVGCIIGPGGSIIKSICHRTGTKMYLSERSGNSHRSIKIFGTIESVSKAVDFIDEKIKGEREKQARNRLK